MDILRVSGLGLEQIRVRLLVQKVVTQVQQGDYLSKQRNQAIIKVQTIKENTTT